MKYGFDFHGVMDNGDTYKNLAKQLLKDGHDVWLITGTMKGDILTNEMTKNKIYIGEHISNIFSVSDYLISEGHVPTFIKPGNPVFQDIYAWNSAKGIFCEKEGIDLHFDDTEEYAKFFNTPIVIVQ